MTSAFAAAQASGPASRATAALERSPTPPPHTTNRTNEASGPGAASFASEPRAANAVPGFGESSDFMVGVPSGRGM
ncbi:hypothetical protein [Streptomyces sp. NPDC058371]|uniref:hypothetical protein n=1 Tax=Streptomyces sp. NPDC058371 TaxID=3346463 RepID=UPI003659D979